MTYNDKLSAGGRRCMSAKVSPDFLLGMQEKADAFEIFPIGCTVYANDRVLAQYHWSVVNIENTFARDQPSGDR